MLFVDIGEHWLCIVFVCNSFVLFNVHNFIVMLHLELKNMQKIALRFISITLSLLHII